MRACVRACVHVLLRYLACVLCVSGNVRKQQLYPSELARTHACARTHARTHARAYRYGCDHQPPGCGAPERVLPLLLSQSAREFSYSHCAFNHASKAKADCARVALWRDFGITMSYTMEVRSCARPSACVRACVRESVSVWGGCAANASGAELDGFRLTR